MDEAIKDIKACLKRGEDITAAQAKLLLKVEKDTAYNEGIRAAASYVDGNWSDAHSMAEHLNAVADGKKPMYAS